MILAFDTETTGKADFNSPASAKHQPHIVQLGAILFDDSWSVRAELNLIVKPDGWTIPEEASNIHGITTTIANSCGVDLSSALSCFRGLFKLANVYVAHNLEFDALIVASNFMRLTDCVGMGSDIRERGFCTMHAMTPICKLPGRYGDYKWPSLQEAYQHAFGEMFDGAHDAMADVRACARLYRWIKERDAEDKL